MMCVDSNNPDYITMELLSWSLNAIDRIFSTRPAGPGERPCPDGTFMAGYIMDSWGQWKVQCLAPLDIEDVEDVYIFAFLTVMAVLLAVALYVQYRKTGKLAAKLVKAEEDLTTAVGETVKMKADLTKTTETMIRVQAGLTSLQDKMYRMGFGIKNLEKMGLKKAMETDDETE